MHTAFITSMTLSVDIKFIQDYIGYYMVGQ